MIFMFFILVFVICFICWSTGISIIVETMYYMWNKNYFNCCVPLCYLNVFYLYLLFLDLFQFYSKVPAPLRASLRNYFVKCSTETKKK